MLKKGGPEHSIYCQTDSGLATPMDAQHYRSNGLRLSQLLTGTVRRGAASLDVLSAILTDISVVTNRKNNLVF